MEKLTFKYKFKNIKTDPSKRTIKNEKLKEFFQNINGSMEFLDYYIPRQFIRFIEIDRKILENKKLVIVHTEDELKKKCQELVNKSVHY